MSLGKDRVFDYNSLQELKEEYTNLLREAKEIAEKMETGIQRVSNLEAQVPSKVKSGTLQSSLSMARIEKVIFDELILTLQRNIENLLTLLPATDRAYRNNMGQLTETMNTLTGVINNYKEIVSIDFSLISSREFNQKLDKMRLKNGIEFNRIDKNIKEVLESSKGLAVLTAAYGGDPINMATGNFSYDKSDLEIQGTYPLVFKRTYNAIDDYKGVLGNQWIHNFEVHLNKVDSSIKVTREDGRVETYAKNQNGEYTSMTLPGQKIVELKEDTDDEIKGYELVLENQQIYKFSNKGKLKKIQDTNDNKVLFTYKEGNLRKISTLSGHIDFYYNENLLEYIKDHTGRKVKFDYKEDNLVKVDLPNNTSFKYTYDILNRLVDVITPRNIKLVTNKYDDISRTSKQIYPDGGKIEIKYLDDEKMTELTEQNGNKVFYCRDEKYRNNRVIYEDGEELTTFNSKDRPVSFTDKNGNTSRFRYDSNGNITRIINPLGETIHLEYENNRLVNMLNEEDMSFKMEYNEKGNLSKMINPKGHETSIEYNKKGQIKSSIQADGSKMKFKYDERDNLISLTYPNGGEAKYEYNELNQVTKSINPNGNEVKYEYDIRGNLIKVTNAKGYSRKYKYNKIEKIVEIIDFDGTKVKTNYNELGKASKTIDQEGNITEYEYDLMWNISKIKDPNGSETLYLYNKLNRLTTIENGLGNRVGYEYDPNGNIVKLISPDKKETKIEYDKLNRRKKIIEVDGYETNYEYNSIGKISKIYDNKENHIEFEYDSLGQLIKQIDTDGNETKFTYTRLGNIETITNPLGDVLKYKYYLGGILKEVLLPEGEKEEYIYDLNGNIVEKKIGKNISIKYKYNSLDQISKIINSDGTEKEFKYTPGGLVRKTIDEKGNETKYTHTKTGNLKSVIDSLGNETKYEYDKVGNLTKLEQLKLIDEGLEQGNKLNKQNNLSVTTKYQYDLIGNLTKVIDGEGNEARFIYDENNRIIKEVDKDGYVTEKYYNQIGQIENIKYSDGKEVKLSYNSLRELTEVEDWLGKTKINLDKLGRTESITTPDKKTVGYEWDKLGKRTKLIYPDGKEVRYEYDKSQKLTKVINGEEEFKYNYDEIGRLKEKIYPNNIINKYSYDDAGVLKSLEYYKDNKIIEKHDYFYDEVGNKIGINRERQGLENENLHYKYDPLNRLTEVLDEGTLIRKYAYDSLGNRVEKYDQGETTKYHYNNLNQLIKAELPEEIRTYEYDKRGNRIKEFANNDLTKTYTFDATDYMTEVWNKNKGTASYKYSGLGNRVSQSLKLNNNNNIEQIDYTLDLTKPYKNILERKENNETNKYLWDGDLLGTTDKDIYLLDELGTPIRHIDTSGGKEEISSYNEFGESIRHDNINNPFGYTGYEYDSVSELNFAQARYYDQEQGRFISEDNIKGSMVYPDSLNDYTYAWNQPLNFVDMDGNVPGLYPLGRPMDPETVQVLGDNLKAGGEWISDKASKGWGMAKSGVSTACGAVKDGVKAGKVWINNKIVDGGRWANNKFNSGLDWVENNLGDHVGIKDSIESEFPGEVYHKTGEIRGSNRFVITKTKVLRLDKSVGYKRGFEINTKQFAIIPAINYSFEMGNGTIEESLGGSYEGEIFGNDVSLSAGLNAAVDTAVVNDVMSGINGEVSVDGEGGINEAIFGGKLGLDNVGVFVNSIVGAEAEIIDGIEYSVKIEKKTFRKSWNQLAMDAATLGAIVIIAVAAKTTAPVWIPALAGTAKTLSTAGALYTIFGNIAPSIVYGGSIGNCEIS